MKSLSVSQPVHWRQLSLCLTWLLQSTSLDECLVVSEPLGVVLIVGTWCSPVQMCLVPLVGAIAAGAETQEPHLISLIVVLFPLTQVSNDVSLICVGNCAIISPSECTAHTAELLHRLIPFYLDNVSDYIAGRRDWVIFINQVTAVTFLFEVSWRLSFIA